MQKKVKRKTPEPVTAQNAGKPLDVEALRRSAAQKLQRILADGQQAWRDCQEPGCRRRRACVAPGGTCLNLPPPPDDDDGDMETARAMAELKRMLRARLDERAANEIEAEQALPPRSVARRRGA